MKIAEITVGGTKTAMTAQRWRAPAAALPIPSRCQRIAEQMLALTLRGRRRRRRGAGARRHRARGQGPPGRARAGQGGGQPGAGPARDQGPALGGHLHLGPRRPPGLERLARDSVELAALAEPDPSARAAGARARWPATSPSSTCGTRRCCRSTCARRSGARAPARRRRWPSDKRVTNSEGAMFGRTDRRVGVRHLGRVFGLAFGARTFRSRSSRSATTPTARSATARTGPRRASPPGCSTPEAVGLEAARRTRRQAGRRARSRPARRR